MSLAMASISVPVDLTNPGQFFACCGYFELASRIDPDALAWFRENRFEVSGNTSKVLDQFFACNVLVDASTNRVDEVKQFDYEEPIERNNERARAAPMRLLEPFNMTLDWWNLEEQRLKTWTAGQRVTDILLGFTKSRKSGRSSSSDRVPSMRDHFAIAVQKWPQDWLRAAMPIKAPYPFSYDSRLSRNNALDLGHTSGGVLQFSPAVDVLTLIGLQRFRPLTVEDWWRNQYCTWREPISINTAAVVVLGLIPRLIDSCFEFPIKRRDSQGRFKLFGAAHPTRRPHHV